MARTILARRQCKHCGVLFPVTTRKPSQSCCSHLCRTEFRSSGFKQRFARMVDASDPNGCHPWLGARRGLGYGHFTMRGRSYKAHRVAWAIANNHPIPDSSVPVLHSCDNRICCNPAHLRLGTLSENYADMIERGRFQPKRGESHYRSKLTAADVRQIRRSTCSQSALASKYGINQSEISRIRNGLSWRSV